jgi:hypothetical protein
VDHPVESFLVRFDVHVGEGDLSFRVVLTGRGRVGSRVFSEDLDAVGVHRLPPVFDHNPHNLRTTPAVPRIFSATPLSPSRRATGGSSDLLCDAPGIAVVGLPRPDEKSLAGTRCPVAPLNLGGQTPRRSTTCTCFGRVSVNYPGCPPRPPRPAGRML